jgi:hypothetical protein
MTDNISKRSGYNVWANYLAGLTSKSQIDAIMDQIALDHYLRCDTATHQSEKKNIVDKTKCILEGLVNNPEESSLHTRCTLDFINILWDKYDCKQVGEIFENFVRIEPTLINLSGTRDHFLHMFHVYLFGLRIISEIISKKGAESKVVLRIEDESDETCVFSYPYNFKEKIFYIWTLASTFHDISYPLQNLPRIENGLRAFTDQCKYTISPLELKLDYSDLSELNDKLRLLSTLYGGKLKIKKDAEGNSIYERIENPYFHKILLSSMRHRNHGLLSGLMLFRIIEDTFLDPEVKSKYKLGATKFNKYTRYFFNDDVSRIALIIAMHNLQENYLPPLPRIKFSEFPLAFILILADEFQEFLRKREELGQELIVLRKIPNIQVKLKGAKIEVLIEYFHDDNEIKTIIKLQKQSDSKKAVEAFWSSSIRTLENRLSAEPSYNFIFKAYKNQEVLFNWVLPEQE